MKTLLLALSILLATPTGGGAQVYGSFGFAPFGGYSYYHAPATYFQPISYYDYRTRSYHRQVILVNGRYYYTF